MTDYADRRFVDQSPRRRRPRGPVNFVTVNDSNRRDGRGADRPQFDTLRDERTGDENRPFFNFLVMFRRLLHLGVGKHRSRKHAGSNENCSAFCYRRLHEQNLHPASSGVQITEAMTMALLPTKAREAIAVATASPQTQPKRQC